jgi:hypothetical protein
MKNAILVIICLFLISCGENKRGNESKKSVDIETQIMNKIDLENWTDTPHVSGRLATESDVNSGAATFVIDGQGEEHKPLNIQIPALAFQIDLDTKEKTPVILIQGELVGEQQIVGIKYLDGTDGVCTLSELEFVESPDEFEK